MAAPGHEQMEEELESTLWEECRRQKSLREVNSSSQTTLIDENFTEELYV